MQENPIKVWFITGCASGLGLAVAEKAISLGHKVAGTSRSLDRFKTTSLHGSPNFLPLQTDLLDEKILSQVIKKTIDTFGKIDVVVNNAGYANPGAVEELSNEELRDNFDINFFAPMNVCRNVIPYLRAQKSGHILNIASIVGFSRFDLCSAYSSSKWALVGLSNTLASELKPFNIHVSAVCPGTFQTPILEGFKYSEKVLPEYDTKNFLSVWLARRPTDKLGNPEKYAESIIHFTEIDNPPIHLFIGGDAVHIAQQQLDIIQNELNSYKALVSDMDLPKPTTTTTNK